MKKLMINDFDNANDLVDFVNGKQIKKDDIALIEHVRGLIIYRLLWFQE